MSLDFWVIYATTIFIASILPGPSMLLALTHGIRYGLRASMMTAAGNTLASALQAGVAITGLGAILIASEWVFITIKWAGATYLIYIGIMMWRSPIQVDETIQTTEKTSAPGWKMFRQAFIVAMGNPKAVVFFTALFPQFIHQGDASLVFYGTMVLVLSVIAFICMMIYSTCGLKIARFVASTRVAKWISRSIGGLFVSGGVALATTK